MRRIPKWITEFPYELDREALLTLARNSKGALGDPREMNFVLFGFADQDDLDGAKDMVEKAGWVCEIQVQSDDSSKKLLTATKSDYVISHEQYLTDSNFFQRVAKMYGVDYDGWFASE